jgi:UTP--glucose-1-phosphate uridylyltransferase
VELPPPLTDFAFAPEQFEELRRLYLAGDLSREKGRLTHKPIVLGHNADDPVVDLTAADPHRRSELAAAGRRAMQRGEVAMLSMAGGMATRFGGGAKACSRLIEGSEETFLSAVCRHVSELEAKFGAMLPWVVMTSFATNEAIHELLEREEWFGLDPARRFAFAQSVLPRIDAEGTALYEHESAASWPDTLTCCAPGHGDTLGRLRDSGTLATLLDRGVKHLLVANIDNLGATLDPVVVGAHLAAVDAGADITVEVVERQAGESGGCVASVEGHA